MPEPVTNQILCCGDQCEWHHSKCITLLWCKLSMPYFCPTVGLTDVHHFPCRFWDGIVDSNFNWIFCLFSFRTRSSLFSIPSPNSFDLDSEIVIDWSIDQNNSVAVDFFIYFSFVTVKAVIDFTKMSVVICVADRHHQSPEYWIYV
jgi:hypothetical protein